jgi:hypothetical protein
MSFQQSTRTLLFLNQNPRERERERERERTPKKERIDNKQVADRNRRVSRDTEKKSRSSKM